ncbi:MAG: DUF4173 domain-containing protein [Myxococcaceae bacterium]|nr:DUF4173 domain-containing protein [Myxococcaceae bacterium]
MTPMPAAESAVDLPTPAPLEAVRRPPVVRRVVLGGAAFTALLAAWSFDGGPLGLGFFLTTVAVATALVVGGGREGWQRGAPNGWLVGAAVTLAGFVVVRDSELVVALDSLAVLWLLALAVRGWNGEDPMVDASLGHVVAAPFKTVGASATTGAAVVSEVLRGSSLSRVLPGLVLPALKVGAIAMPIIGLVTLLLASGDAAFGAQLEGVLSALWAVPVDAAVRAGFVGFGAFVLTAGGVTWALRRRSPRGPVAEAPLHFTLGAPEAFALLGGLTLVLMLFALVSARCAFAPDACQLPSGVTYSEYARRGFWELLLVAGIVLMTLLSVPRRAQLGTPAAVVALNATATALVVAAVPMLLSAVNRMMLYEAAYGFTRQRLFSQIICVTLGLLMVWRAITLWTWPRRFAVGAVATVTGVLALFNAMNPDAFIAKKNVERDGVIDAAYLRDLSADAAGVLRQIPPHRLDEFHASLFSRPRTAPGTWASFNLARACDELGGGAWAGPWCP